MKAIIIKFLIVATGFQFNLIPQVVERFAEIHVRVKPEIYYLTTPDVSLQELYLTNFMQFFKGLDKSFVHLITNPWTLNGTGNYIAGIAPVCSKKLRAQESVSMSAFKSSKGNEDRTEHSVIAIVHELGHQFGANHDDSSCNIMNSNALACPDVANLQWTAKSKYEIRRCLNVNLFNKRKGKRNEK